MKQEEVRWRTERKEELKEAGGVTINEEETRRRIIRKHIFLKE